MHVLKRGVPRWARIDRPGEERPASAVRRLWNRRGNISDPCRRRLPRVHVFNQRLSVGDTARAVSASLDVKRRDITARWPSISKLPDTSYKTVSWCWNKILKSSLYLSGSKMCIPCMLYLLLYYIFTVISCAWIQFPLRYLIADRSNAGRRPAAS